MSNATSRYESKKRRFQAVAQIKVRLIAAARAAGYSPEECELAERQLQAAGLCEAALREMWSRP